jgi:hypothetical protein
MHHKKSRLAFFLFLLMLGLNILPLRAQAEKDILEKMITAMGGREALAQIKDTKTTGTMEISQMGMTTPMTIYQKDAK